MVVTADFTVDLERTSECSTRRASEMRLTPIEWGICSTCSCATAGKLVTQRQLLQDVWGPAYGEESNYLRVHMAHLRRKLEPTPSQPRYFITEPGMGYRFVG